MGILKTLLSPVLLNRAASSFLTRYKHSALQWSVIIHNHDSLVGAGSS